MGIAYQVITLKPSLEEGEAGRLVLQELSCPDHQIEIVLLKSAGTDLVTPYCPEDNTILILDRFLNSLDNTIIGKTIYVEGYKSPDYTIYK